MSTPKPANDKQLQSTLHARYDDESEDWYLCLGVPDITSSDFEAVAKLHGIMAADAYRIVSNIKHALQPEVTGLTEQSLGWIKDAASEVGSLIGSYSNCNNARLQSLEEGLESILARDAELKAGKQVMVSADLIETAVTHLYGPGQIGAMTEHEATCVRRTARKLEVLLAATEATEETNNE